MGVGVENCWAVRDWRRRGSRERVEKLGVVEVCEVVMGVVSGLADVVGLGEDFASVTSRSESLRFILGM